MDIPVAYTLSKFNQYCGKTVQNNRWANGSCPVCHEGDSFGKKKRLYFFFKDDYLFCHNCGQSWNPYFWIKEVTSMTWKEIRDEVKEYTGDDVGFVERTFVSESNFEVPTLPGECVNISDVNQLIFYKDNWVVDKAIAYIKKRRLHTAKFSPKTYYVCLNDKYHKHRIIIPYYNEYGRIESYISRTFLDRDERMKYMLKFNSPKAIFNLDKIDITIPYVFIIEGPIDSMFIQNGVGISGVYLTDKQEDDLNAAHPFHKKIWIFDNFRKEGSTVKKIIADKLKDGETVFLYEGDFEPFKDLNEYCTAKEQDSIDPALIVNSSYSGGKGLLRLASA